MTTGVIIGRFQVPELTLGHNALIVKAYEAFDQIGFLLGTSTHPDRDNPLPFEARRPMLEAWDPKFISVLYDVPGDDQAWSRDVDYFMDAFRGDKNLGDITLVGGRNSFIPSYSGKYPTLEIPVWIGRSGTEARWQTVISPPMESRDFRKGIIWAVYKYGKEHE